MPIAAERGNHLSRAELEALAHLKTQWKPEALPRRSERESFYLHSQDMYVPLVETSSLEPQTLTEFITVFDTDWKERGLEEDWYKLRSTLKKEVGFSMKAQMDNLKRTDPENVAKWKTETSYMISGYALEYLSNNVIYPCKYRKSPENPDQMGDPQYGYTDIVDFISEKERGGSVKDAARKAKAFFDTDETPLGSLFVYLSPEGPTGLTTDKGVKPLPIQILMRLSWLKLAVVKILKL
jgi:hypothetical protein